VKKPLLALVALLLPSLAAAQATHQAPPAPAVVARDPNALIEPPTTMPPPGEPLARRTPTPMSRADRGSAPGRAGDGASVDSVLAALYASVSHPDGAEPDWARMRAVMLPVGMFIPPKRPKEEFFTVLDVDGFRDRVRKGAAAAKEKGDSTAFYENEVARRLDCFGNVCQAFSTYEARRAPSDEKPFVSGINSIQIINDGERWWIASVVWDTERTGNPIPDQYKPK